MDDWGYSAYCRFVTGVGILLSCVLMFAWGMNIGEQRVRAFDVPDQYLRQGYHQCDSPSGWCENEKEERKEPCGKR